MLVLGMGLGTLLPGVHWKEVRRSVESLGGATAPGNPTGPAARERSHPVPRPAPGKAAPEPGGRRDGPEPGSSLPRLALVIDDFGYVAPERVTRICELPIPMTLSVLPFLLYSKESAEIGHAHGKGVMLHLPMEPVGYPRAGLDPGPGAILHDLSEAEDRQRVRAALEDIPYREGLNNHMGSRITTDRQRMTWVLEEARAQHVFFVDSRTEKDSVAFEVARELHIPAVQRKVFLDDDKSFEAMAGQWNRAVDLARKEGEVLVIGHPFPETIEALEKLVPGTRGKVRFVNAGDLAR